MENSEIEDKNSAETATENSDDAEDSDTEAFISEMQRTFYLKRLQAADSQERLTFFPICILSVFAVSTLFILTYTMSPLPSSGDISTAYRTLDLGH